MTEKKGGSAMNDTPKAELRVVLETDGPKIELNGTRNDILTAWAWLTFSICSNFDIPTDFLAAKMPALLKFLKENIRGQTLVDMSGLSNPEVIEKLAAENEALRNPPLTLEELREMDGEPVWVVELNDYPPRWGLVYWRLKNKSNFVYVTVNNGASICAETFIAAGGKIYRRKPAEDVSNLDTNEREEG